MLAVTYWVYLIPSHLQVQTSALQAILNLKCLQLRSRWDITFDSAISPRGYSNKPPPLLVVCGDKSGRPASIKVEQAVANNTTFNLWWAGVPDITNTPTGKIGIPTAWRNVCVATVWIHAYGSHGPEMLLLWHHPPPTALTSSTASSGETPEPWGRGLIKTALLREEENGILPTPKGELSYKMLRKTNWA